MAVDRRLLELLCCPVTKIPVNRLPANQLKTRNDAVREGAVKYADGSVVTDELEEALITENGTTVYRVDDSIPVMLEEQGIPTIQLDNW